MKKVFLLFFILLGSIGCVIVSSCVSGVVQLAGLKLVPCLLTAIPLAAVLAVVLDILRRRAYRNSTLALDIAVISSVLMPSAIAAIALYIFLNKVDVSAKAFIFLVPFVFALFYTAVFVAACLAVSCAVDRLLNHRNRISAAMEDV